MKRFAIAVGLVLAAATFIATAPHAANQTAGTMKASLTALHEALNAGNKEGIVRLFADDATIEDPVGSPLKVGRAAIDTFYAGAIEHGVTMDIVKVDERPDRTCVMEVNIHIGPKIARVLETYTFTANGKIATMKAVPIAKE